MAQPLIRGFKMHNITKSPIIRVINFLIIVTIFGGLVGAWPFLSFISKDSEADFVSPKTKENERFTVIQGNSFLPILKPTSTKLNIVKEIKMVVTAYSSSVLETDSSPYITASGAFVQDGIVANNLYPFGTKIRIPEIYGDKIFVVEDRMNSRKGYYHIDIWFPSYLEAKNFGAKRAYIEIIRES